MKNLFYQFVVILLATLLLAAICEGGNTIKSPSSTSRFSRAVVDTPRFAIPFVYDIHGLASDGIYFGVNPNATDGIDPALGEREYPPMCLPGCWWAVFKTAGGNAVLDLRPYTSPAQVDTYRVYIDPDETMYPLTFSWPDLTPYYNGSVRLKFDSSGSTFDIDMKAQNSYTMATGPVINSFPGYYVYIIAEGPLPANSMQLVSTVGYDGSFEGIVNAPVLPSVQGKAATGTTVWFEYGPTWSYGSSTSSQLVSDGSNTNISSEFDTSSMPPNSRYHFRAVAQNILGTSYGGDRFISKGSPPPLTYADTGKFRTATYLDWADAKDVHLKRKSINPKPDKIVFKFTVTAPANATGLKLKFNMNVTGALTKGTTKTDTLASVTGTGTNEIDYPAAIVLGDVFQVDGIGHKGKKLTAKFEWATSPRSTIGGMVPDSNFLVKSLRLPMPNLHNVGEGCYGGVRQTSVVVNVGFNNDLNGAHTVYHSKYSDVLKSFVKEQRTGDIHHINPPRCINTVDKNHAEILRRQKSLPPDKHNNVLFAEQLTLKMNVLASDSGIFPQGFGDLIYDNHVANPTAFDGEAIGLIVAQVDSFLGCDEDPKITADSSEYLNVVHLLNGAFSAPLDTESWSGKKVICTGVRTAAEVPFLYPNPSPTPRIAIGPVWKSPLFGQPKTFALDQNYPNPFNPSTTIRFNLPDPAVVTLKVYNVLGQEVAKLLDAEQMEDGEQEVQFNAWNFASGVYFYRIEAQNIVDEENGTLGQKFTSVKKMMLVK